MHSDPTSLDIRIGPFSPKLAEQLKDSGVSAEVVEEYQRDADEITRLQSRERLTYRAATTARNQLVKSLELEVRLATKELGRSPYQLNLIPV